MGPSLRDDHGASGKAGRSAVVPTFHPPAPGGGGRGAARGVRCEARDSGSVDKEGETEPLGGNLPRPCWEHQLCLSHDTAVARALDVSP